MTPEEIIANFQALSPAAQRQKLDAMPRETRIELLKLMEEYTRRKAKTSLSAFVGRNDLIPAKHHRLMIEHLEALERYDIKNLMMCLPPGAAKALALTTLVPTPTGWSTMGELEVGDQVFDENGSVCSVTWKSPVWKNRPVYAVTTDCGDEIVADRDHEWLVRLCGKNKVFKIKETHQLHRRRAKLSMIKRAAALSLPDVDLPIDPYLLGVWLGNGTSASMSITSSDEDMPWMRDEMHRLGYVTSNKAAKCLFGVLGVRDRFVQMGLIQDPAHKTFGRKHIPEVYMRAAHAQRLALLQGLIDTDGTVCKRSGSATFINTNLELALQTRELVRSLGVKAGWSEGRAMLNGVDHGAVYRVFFYHAEAARIPRKRARCRNQYRTPDTYIDVTPTGTADTVCIEVNSPSHLFLCGESMTPTHNSTYSSILFPAWYMGRHPKDMLLLTSNTMELAETFGRRIRNIVGGADFQSVFGFGLSSDSTAAARWSNDKGGELLGSGVGGSIVGRRCDCLVASTQIETYSGPVRIDQVRPGDYVLSAEQDSRPCYRRVVAVAQREADEYLRVHTASGCVVESTGNHRIRVARGWVEASALVAGDDGLRVLRYGLDSHEMRPREEVAPRRGVSADMQPIVRFRDKQPRKGLCANLQQLWQACTRRSESLLGRVPKGSREKERRAVQEGSANAVVLGLRQRVQATDFYAHAKVLLGRLQEYGTRFVDGWRRQSDLQARSGLQPVFAGGAAAVSGVQGSGKRAGRTRLCCVWRHEAVEHASHRYEPAEQYRLELGDDVPRLSCGPARSGTPQAFYDTVSMVERVCSKETVYDLQIDGTECFFANGILVHNCLIMDDVVRSKEDVSSETMRERTWAWYTADVLTRLKPRARQVFCNTRWHEDDLAGRILDRDSKDWTVLKLEMENTREDDPLGRKVGERLWAEWFTPEMVDRAKQDPASWSALYQQNPSPEGGGEFKKGWVEFYDNPPSKKNTTNLIIVDPANEKSRRSDYTAMWVIGMGGDGNAYILDIIRDRMNLSERTSMLFKLHRKYRPTEVRYERYGMMGDIDHIKLEMDRLSYRFRIREVKGQVKKEDRIRRLIPWFKDGKVVFPRELVYTDLSGRSADLVRVFIEEELAPFPVAKHDDLMDALSRLAEPGLILPKHIPEDEQKLMFGDVQFEFQPIDSVMGY